MRSRSWLGAFGLRGRIVGVVLATAVATLSVAALVVLPRLEGSLRSAAQAALEHDLSAKHALAPFRALAPELQYVLDSQSPADPYRSRGRRAADRLQEAEQTLLNDVGATHVVLIGPLGPDGQGTALLRQDARAAASMPPGDIARAFLSRRPVTSSGSVDATPYVFESIPISRDYVLAASQSISEIPAAVHAVQVAFVIAALAGVALTLLLAIPLSATVVRRLRRLRHSALLLAAQGVSAEVPPDRSRDEVGDLARTFALMQRRLQDQEEARRAFVATASHELRTPLASLDVMLELLAEDLRSGQVDLEDAQLLLDRARAQSRRLGRLASDLLDLSRIDAQVQLRSEPVELGELSRAVLAEFELGSRERGVVCTLHESGAPVWALGDPGSVARILRILLDNAIRVAPAGSSIDVVLGGPEDPHRPGASWPTLSVIDRGPGVRAEEREMIFERFKRGRQTGGEAGFGLGLAIGRELAQRMGGTLSLLDGDGAGSRFVLTLPLAQPPVQEPLTPAPAA